MVIKTKFYFESKVLVTDLVEVIKQIATNVTVDISDKGYGNITFVYNHEMRLIWFQPDNVQFGGKRNGTHPDTISLNAFGDAIKIITKIGSYFGGHLNKSDTNDDEIHVPKIINVIFLLGCSIYF